MIEPEILGSQLRTGLQTSSGGSQHSTRQLMPAPAGLDVGERRWLNRLIVQAFILRAAVALILHFTGLSRQFAPDEDTYLGVGSQLARYWSGDAFLPPGRIAADQPTAYFYLNGAFIFIFGGVLPLKLLNCFIGARVCYYQYRLSRGLFGTDCARFATQLAAFLPSLVLWSALNIRDVWAIFLILYTSWKTFQLKAGYSHAALVQLLAAIAALSSFRQYLFFVVAMPPVVGLLLGTGKRAGRNFLLAGLASVGVLVLAELGMARHSLDLMSLEALAEAREDMQYGAGSAFGRAVDTSTPGRALAYLPVGVAYFLFSPFPWNITSPLKAASLPEILFIYWLTTQMIPGVAYAVRHRLRDAAQVVILTTLLIVSYSLGSGNVGTLYRHRAQALPYLLMFGSLGLELRRRRSPRMQPRAPSLGSRFSTHVRTPAAQPAKPR